MKKILSLIIFICFLPNLLLIAQKSSTRYWFCIKMETVVDRNLNAPVYKIVKSYPEIKSGTQEDFVKALQINLKRTLVTMGPFAEKSNAQFAQKHYEKLHFYNDEEIVTEIQSIKCDSRIEVYYFASEIYFKEKTRAMIFKRIPCAVAEGTNLDFKQSAYESLTQKKFYNGPFSTKLEAEIAKFYQRLYGEEISSWQSMKNSEKKLQKMVDNFENIIKENLSFTMDSLSNPASYKVNLKIPPKYFDEYSMLVLSTGLVYEDKETSPLKEQTMQGERVEDNNPVIIYNEGIEITESFPITDKKIDKIRIKCTFLNNNYLIKGKDVELSWTFNQK